MLEATLATMGWVVSNYLISGKEPVPMGNENFTAAPSGTFHTGKGLLNIAANKQEQFRPSAVWSSAMTSSPIPVSPSVRRGCSTASS